MKRIVDLSMPVHGDMLTFPRVPPPALAVLETHQQFAERIGAAEYGVDSLTAHYLVATDDHVGTHCDARKHIVPDAGGPESIPLEWCIGDGRGLVQLGTNPQYDMTADVTGEFPIAGAVTNWASIARYMMTEDMGLDEDSVDLASFAAAASAYPYIAGVHFSSDDDADGASAVSRVISSVGADIINARNGKLQCIVFRALTGNEPVAAAIDTENCVDIRAVQMSSEFDPAPSRIRVAWQKNHKVQTSGLNTTALPADQQFAPLESLYAFYGNIKTATIYERFSDLQPFGGALLTNPDAQAVANGVGIFITNQLQQFDVDLPITVGIGLEVGSVVTLKWPIAGLRNGAPGQIVREIFRSEDSIVTMRVLMNKINTLSQIIEDTQDEPGFQIGEDAIGTDEI